MSVLATDFSFDGQTDVYRGETRDVYTINGTLISVATDRLTAFGHLFPNPIPYKGQVLNQLTYFFAEATRDIAPNWIESSPDPNVLIGKKCKRFDVNIVIRGALIGHAWRIYESGARQISGVELAEGMNEYDLFDEPIITPSTKAQHGYEEDISATEIIEQGLMSESEFERLSIISRQLFIRGKQIARNQGLILADTKYEFGLYDGEIYVIDELHTPDASRYYHIHEYEKYLNDRQGTPPENLSREFVRQWLLEQGYSGLDDQTVPEIGLDFVDAISLLYIALYEQLTGEEFVRPDLNINEADRIKTSILTELNKK